MDTARTPYGSGLGSGAASLDTVILEIPLGQDFTEAEFDTRFQGEARIASQLSDPHIVVVHDFGIDPEHGPYLVMEFLQGQSLRERLQSQDFNVGTVYGCPPDSRFQANRTLEATWP